MDPNSQIFNEFFESDNGLSEEIARTCEGVMSIYGCERTLKTLVNNKTPGTDRLTSELYHYLWNLFGSFVVSSFNYSLRSLSAKGLFP